MKHLLTVKASLYLQMQKATSSWQEVASSNRRLRRENEDMQQQIERLRHRLQNRGQQQQHQHQHQQEQEVKWPASEQGERACLLGNERDGSAAQTTRHNYHERHQDINQRVDWLHQKLSEQQQQQQPAQQQQQQQQDEEDWQALLIELFGDGTAPEHLTSGCHIAAQQQQQPQEGPTAPWQAPIKVVAAASAPVPPAEAEMQYLRHPPSPNRSSSALLEPIAAAEPALSGATAEIPALIAGAAAPAHAAEHVLTSNVVDAASMDFCLPSTVIGFSKRAGKAGGIAEAAAVTALAAAAGGPAAGAPLDDLQAYLPTPAAAASSAYTTVPAAPYFDRQQLSGEIEHWQLGNMPFAPGASVRSLPAAVQQQQQQQKEEEQHQQFILPQQCVWQQQLPDLMPLDKPLSLPDLGQHGQSTDSSSSWALAMPPLVFSTGLHAAAPAPDGADASDTRYFIAVASDTG